MTPQQAADILAPWLDKNRLYDLGKYLFVGAGSTEGVLDGEFTADELEAIVMWMRNPEALTSLKPSSAGESP